MYLEVFEHPQSVTPEELQHDLLMLPEWRREKVLAYRFLIDQVLCAKAYLLLKKGLKTAYAIDDNPRFGYIMHEKPVLSDYPDIHFNLSHCKKGVLCVIDDQPIGCDIEEIEKTLDLTLCHYCHNADEVAEIVSATDPCVEFTKLWTKKEAALKLTGDGINDDLPSLFTQDRLDQLKFETIVHKEKGYVYSICKRAKK